METVGYKQSGMKTVAIIQARFNSVRLPGKVLKNIGSRAVLGWVIKKAEHSTLTDEVVVATGTDLADNEIERYCDWVGVACFRGACTNVLDRYYKAATKFNADVIVRLTGDNPFMDHRVIDEVVEKLGDTQSDFATNRLSSGYPAGQHVDVMTMDALQKAWERASRPRDREHVTSYIYTHDDEFKVCSVGYNPRLEGYRMTIDTHEDLAFARAINGHIEGDTLIPWTDIIKYIDDNPTLWKIRE